MTKKQKKLIDQLFDLAVDHDDNPHRAKLAACLTIRDTPIAWGFNSMKSHPFQAQFAKNDQSIYWHAETNCIHNALKRFRVEELKNSTLYVVRAKKAEDRKTWVRGLAQPCPGCMMAITQHGISKVVFTTDIGTIAKLKFEDD